ncbi:hypothetical protein NDA13_006428 [Ustilago tritici]|nr:hypothetical protein NDA13_006428 [Ustilago tritici]
MAAETLAVPDPDVMVATIVDSNDSNVGGGGGATESRPTLSRASSIGYSDDGSMTSSFRTHHSCASASMEGIDLLGAPSSSTGALPLSDLFETYFSPRIAGIGGKHTVLDEAEEPTRGIMSASVKSSRLSHLVTSSQAKAIRLSNSSVTSAP